MGMLQPLQMPEKPGATPRFADLFAARTRDDSLETGAVLDDPIGVLPGNPLNTVVHDFAARGGLMPLTQPVADTAVEVSVTTDTQPIAIPAVDVGTPGMMPRAVTESIDSPVALPGARTLELPTDVASTAADTGPALDGESPTALPAMDMRKLANALPGSELGQRPTPTAGPVPPGVTADAADSKAPADAMPHVSLAETLAEDGEHQPVTQRVVSGVEVATLATLSPRANGMPTPDVRNTSSRPGQSTVNALSATAPAAVDEGAAEAPAVFDPSGGFEDGPGQIGLTPAVTTRPQQASAVTTAMPDAPNTLTSAVDLTPRNTAVVDDLSALDQLDAPAEMAELSIDTPVDDPNWSEALNYRLQWLAQKGGAQSARIQLNPVELGPMEVHVEVVDEVATVQIRADHGLTREALEQAAPRLRELMAGAGLENAELEVTGGDAEDPRRAGAQLADGQSGSREDAPSTALNADNAVSGAPDAESSARNADTGNHDTTPGGLNIYV